MHASSCPLAGGCAYTARDHSLRETTMLPRRLPAYTLFVAMLSACSTLPPEAAGPLRSEQLLALTQDMTLLRLRAGQPAKPLATVRVQGLAAGDRLVGIDYRVARGVLYGLGQSGRLYTVDADSGQATQVGSEPAVLMRSEQYGMDFNPTVDRIRVIGDRGGNMRLHPDTGKAIDGNPAQEGVQPDATLQYLADDVRAGKKPAVMAVAYTYNPRNDKVTTLYGIDADAGTLVVQGSREDEVPFVSPDKGGLRTVGSLGLPRWDVIGLEPGGQGYGPILEASFDISDVKNVALLAARQKLGATQLYEVNLQTGKASRLGRIDQGQPLAGLAIIP